jgi:hypothetical protein
VTTLTKRNTCVHGKLKYYCRDCGGSDFCKHGKRKSLCENCGGGSLCTHVVRKDRCRICRGNGICEHSRQVESCKECGGFSVMATRLLYCAKSRAKRKGVPCTITKENILYLIGDGVCPVLGMPYNLSCRIPQSDSASLDRFAPELGYTKENCFVISRLANMIKSNATPVQIMKVANWAAEMEDYAREKQ